MVILIEERILTQSENGSILPRPPQGVSPRNRTNTPLGLPVLHTLANHDIRPVGLLRMLIFRTTLKGNRPIM